jgi:hypothetical protein
VSVSLLSCRVPLDDERALICNWFVGDNTRMMNAWRITQFYQGTKHFVRGFTCVQIALRNVIAKLRLIDFDEIPTRFQILS